MTQLVLEQFQGPGTYTSGSPGTNFYTVSGTMYLSAVGPRNTLVPSPGWSFDPRVSTCFGAIGLTNSPNVNAVTNGFVGAWFRFKTFSSPNTVPFISLRNNLSAGQNKAATVSINADGSLKLACYQGVTTNSAAPLFQPNTWYYIGIGWHRVSGTTFDIAAYYKTLGGSMTVAAQQLGLNQISPQCAVQVGPEGSGNSFAARIGGFGLYSLPAGLSDVTYDASLLEPVETRYTWYLDALGGSDNNSGMPGSPWQTIEQFNVQSANAGLLDVNNGWSNGSTLEITNTFTVGTNYFLVQTRGLTMQKAANVAYANIVPWTNLPNADFSLVPGLTKVYKTPSASSLAVVWEDDKLENHANGTTLASVTNTLQTTAGTFWTDGTNTYVHPLGDTNPNSDGKVYTRSINRAGGSLAVFRVRAFDVRMTGIYTSKTILAALADASGGGGYGIQFDNASGGTSRVDNCYVYYGGKHGIGITDSSTNSYYEVFDNDVEQCSPWESTAYVSFNDNATANNNRHYYLRNKCIKAFALVNSTNGANGDAMISHNISGGPQFSSLTFENCYFPQQRMSISVTSYAYITNSQVGGTVLGLAASGVGATNYINNSTYDSDVPAVIQGLVQIQNSIIRPQRALDAGWIGTYGLLSGGLTAFDTTIDISNLASTSTQTNYIWNRNGALTFRVYNSIFITKPSTDCTLLGNATNTDSFFMTNNVYKLGTGSLVMTSFGDGGGVSNRTLGQWQGLGFDAGTVNQDPCLSANYRPYAKTPCWNVGGKLGPLVDFSGKLYQSRRTAGAYEFDPPLWGSQLMGR